MGRKTIQVMTHIGDCDFCPKKAVVIASGWTTRNRKACISCNKKQKDKKAAERMKSKPRRTPYGSGESCIECGESKRRLEHSHILSVGAHPELKDDPENIVPHCRRCHNAWEFEAGFRVNSNTYQIKKEYILSHGGKDLSAI